MDIGLPAVSPRRQRALTRALRATIGVVLVVGLGTRNLSVVLNGALALVVTFVPAMLDRDYRLDLDPWVTLWITLALCLHTLGMLGIYDEVWWYDHVTHTLSATIVAGVGYVLARAVDERSDAIYLPGGFMFGYVLLFTLALGVVWEVLEFVARLVAEALRLDPVLVQYGLGDTMLDLVFDTVGALLVAAFGTDAVSDLVETVSDRLGASSTDGDRRSTGSVETTRLGRVVRDEPMNARVSWLLVAGLAAAAVGSVADGSVVPAALAGVAVVLAVVPAAAYRTPRAMLPWQLLVVASLPAVGAAFARPWLSSSGVTYLAVATVALVVAVELHLFTPVEMTPEFAVLFVAVTTTAIAGGWAVARWLADLYLGTGLLLVPGRTDAEIEAALMWEFGYAVAAGVLAGVGFEWGFRGRDGAPGGER